MANFYTQLLECPPTRKYFLKKDGEIDQEYLQLVIHHLTKFCRRTASAELDDDYAAYVEYVGRTHTSQGADPKIYIPKRKVIGQVGFVQHAIGQALRAELEEIDPELEARASRAWNLLLMVYPLAYFITGVAGLPCATTVYTGPVLSAPGRWKVIRLSAPGTGTSMTSTAVNC